ncbi:Glycosyl transferases group 1 [Phycisphaerae bacterium RAS1]|nr:Glycosyl transferases group 1 [Phycisphaerae bacterium RAS1]
MKPKVIVVDLVSDDLAVGRSLSLAALRQHGRVVRETLILGGEASWLGMGVSPVSATHRITSRIAPRWIAARRVQGAIDAAVARHEAQSCVLHIWSPRALAWAAPAVRPTTPMLIDVDLDDRLDRVARWRRALPSNVCVGLRVPTAAAQRALGAQGVRVDDIPLIRGLVDYSAVNEARHSDARARLGITHDMTTILILPPITPAAGSFGALWAALLLEKIRRDVRVLVPQGGPESRRLAALARATRHDAVVSLVDPACGLPLLLAACNLALFTPPGDAPVWALPWAMAAGVRIVASAVPAVTEMLAHGHNAWLCRPANPRDACRRCLRALERTDESRKLGEAARSGAFRVFSRQRMIEQYEQAYANLLAGRPAGAGVVDAALVG